MDCWSPEPTLGVAAFGSQEGQGHVDAFDLAGPALGAGAAVDEVGFEFVEPGGHLGVDVQHRAADLPRVLVAENAAMSNEARCAVVAALISLAGSQLPR
ncbi:hypothetical protein [Actinophytocola algeriensis]|uniref:Uncharacterized protein n=1 Tax=Actinophytocola algeriensis TaxID=1768010 RepID=A0A7W7Q300_9PSEU|nr:hypothetical protein [Actinophytocola algeriensis]MBB4906110.1 hypothetical protein [Actinophytocola algeriensis]MBE1472205.1 hypothetical protein [Actinophytocola algeriensis]